ncbi:uncharacterized protein METZ01_LOCUS492232, partial [marine metagenome]
QMGVAYFELELYDKAIESFIPYALENNDDALVFSLIGKSFLNVGDYISALGAFQKSLSINSHDFRTQYYIGECNYLTENFGDAAKSYKKALNINPDSSEAHYKLGLVYLKLKKRRSAKKELNILYMLNQDLFDSLNFYYND